MPNFENEAEREANEYRAAMEKQRQAHLELIRHIRDLELEVDGLANNKGFCVMPKAYGQLNDIKALILKAESLARQVRL